MDSNSGLASAAWVRARAPSSVVGASPPPPRPPSPPAAALLPPPTTTTLEQHASSTAAPAYRHRASFDGSSDSGSSNLTAGVSVTIPSVQLSNGPAVRRGCCLRGTSAALAHPPCARAAAVLDRRDSRRRVMDRGAPLQQLPHAHDQGTPTSIDADAVQAMSGAAA